MPDSGDPLLANRYVLKRLLGEGGMCQVFLAQDTRLDKQWAIKKMSQAGKEADSESLQAEAAILSQLSHPRLVPTVDFFVHEGIEHLVMDFCPGQTLAAILKEERLPPPAALKMIEQLAEVLRYLHQGERPIVFRDVKPENIMVDEQGDIKLIDFGIARYLRTDAKSDTQNLGTPGYAAPEQYGRGQSDQRTDIYGLGATLHHALSGRHPSQSPFTFPPITQLCPDLPMALERLLDKTLALKQEERFQSVAEFLEAFEALKERRDTVGLFLRARLQPEQAQVLLGEVEESKSHPSLSEEIRRTEELEFQLADSKRQLEKSHKELSEEQEKRREVEARLTVDNRALKSRLSKNEILIERMSTEVETCAEDKKELELSLSESKARARNFEVEVMRYEEHFKKASAQVTTMLAERDGKIQHMLKMYQELESKNQVLWTQYEKGQEYLHHVSTGQSAGKLTNQRVSELELEVRELEMNALRLEKQRKATLAQLTLVRDQAKNLQANSGEMESVKDDHEPSEVTPSTADSLELQVVLERACERWLEAERQLAFKQGQGS